jgi:hypothetical protein
VGRASTEVVVIDGAGTSCREGDEGKIYDEVDARGAVVVLSSAAQGERSTVVDSTDVELPKA